MLKLIISDIKGLLARVEYLLDKASQEIWHIIQEVFKAEEQVLMAQAFNLLRQEAVTLQNSNPGITSKDMEQRLKDNAKSVLVGLEGQLAYTALVTVIGTIMHDLSVPDTQGNSGNLTGGFQNN